MIRLFCIGLLGQLFFSCINMNDPETQAEYIESRDRFDESLVRLFPDRLPNNMLGFGFSDPYKNVPGRLHLMTKFFSEREYAETRAKYLNQSKHHKTSGDKCFFLVDNYKGVNQEKCVDFYPIPTEAIFETSPDGKSINKVTNSEVFFIDVQSGDFLRDGDKHSRQELPETWTHGYSTGVTTNDRDKTIKLWLVVW